MRDAFYLAWKHWCTRVFFVKKYAICGQFEVFISRIISSLMLIFSFILLSVIRCAIWYHLYNFKNVKNAYGGVLILSKVAGFSLQGTKFHNVPHLFSGTQNNSLSTWKKIFTRMINEWRKEELVKEESNKAITL